VREIRLLRSRWRGLETESRLGLHGHERGNPGHRQDHDLTDYRASPRPYQSPDRPNEAACDDDKPTGIPRSSGGRLE
jgi:hypothetical protein